MRSKWVEIVEGESKLRVPEKSIEMKEPPQYPVFYNLAAKLNRDISILVVSATSGKNFADIMAGLGARSVRVANESGREILFHANDINVRAIAACRRNAALNGVGSLFYFTSREANELCFRLSSRGSSFDYVDIDPFGSPATYIQAGVSIARDESILSVTATDTAVLCGAQRKVAYRRYIARTIRNQFTHEAGLRILAGFVCRVAAINDRACIPVFGHCTRHYIRAYFRVLESASMASKVVDSLAYVALCKKCSSIFVTKEIGKCDECSGEVVYTGPMWTGRISEPALLSGMKKYAIMKKMNEAAVLIDRIEKADDLPPYGFRIEDLCSLTHVPTVPYSRVKEILESKGFKCEKQPYEKTGIKTNAPYREVLDAIREATKLRQ